MNANEFVSATIPIPFRTAKAIIHQCEKEYLLPRQVIARSFGEPEPFGEPIIFKIPGQDRCHLPDYKDFSALQTRKPVGRRKGGQKKVYLSVLSQIIKAMPQKFAECAKPHGTKRPYFGRSREDVEHTGRSNEANKIPETEAEWWASVNNSGDKKQTILADLMRLLGFSADYIALISWAPCYTYPALQIQFKV